MLGAWACLVIRGDFDAAAIVFESAADNFSSAPMKVKAATLEFRDKVHDANDFPKGRGEGNVFSFSCTESNERLHFGSPDDGTTGVHDNIASSGVSGQWIMGGAMLPGASPICVNEAFKAACGIRLEV